MEQNFTHTNGSISIEGSSSAQDDGGAVLESSSGVAGDLLTICKSKLCILRWLQTCGDVTRPVLHVVRFLQHLQSRNDGSPNEVVVAFRQSDHSSASAQVQFL